MSSCMLNLINQIKWLRIKEHKIKSRKKRILSKKKEVWLPFFVNHSHLNVWSLGKKMIKRWQSIRSIWRWIQVKNMVILIKTVWSMGWFLAEEKEIDVEIKNNCIKFCSKMSKRSLRINVKMEKYPKKNVPNWLKN